MRAEKAHYPVTMMARVLKVSRSGFYSWLAWAFPTTRGPASGRR